MPVINYIREAPSPPPIAPYPLRSTHNIVWSCVLTIFACTWTSLHPNIQPHASLTERVKYRGQLLLAALFSPELIVLWAARQWIASSEVGKQYEEFGWTQTHGHFAIMGGFLYKTSSDQPDELDVVLLPYRDPLESLIQRKKITLTEGEIQDRSKGDIVSKGLIVLQTLWFMVQFFARLNQRLPVTEIELVTLAYAILNIAIYYFWWKKPQNVMYPIRVYADEPQHLLLPASPICDESEILLCPPPPDPKNIAQNLEIVPPSVCGPQQSPELPPCRDPEKISNGRQNQQPPLTASLHLFGRLVMLTGEHNSDLFPTDNVGYSGTLSRDDTYAAAAIAATLAMVFGAVHMAAWNSAFPSTAEKNLWRASALSITCIPFYAFLSFWSFYRHGYIVKFVKAPKKSVPAKNTSALLLPIVIGTIYVVARIILIVQMLVLLRDPPLRTFQTVSWTNYLPHF